MSIDSHEEAQQGPGPPNKEWAGWPDHVPQNHPLNQVFGFPLFHSTALRRNSFCVQCKSLFVINFKIEELYHFNN